MSNISEYIKDITELPKEIGERILKSEKILMLINTKLCGAKDHFGIKNINEHLVMVESKFGNRKVYSKRDDFRLSWFEELINSTLYKNYFGMSVKPIQYSDVVIKDGILYKNRWGVQENESSVFLTNVLNNMSMEELDNLTDEELLKISRE